MRRSPGKWQKSGDQDHLREVLAYMVGCLLEVATLLYPFMPSTAEKIRDVFGSGVLTPLTASLFPKAEKIEPASSVQQSTKQ